MTFGPKTLFWLAFPFIGFSFGSYLDRKETERMSRFRDKSALYGGQQRYDEAGKPIPSWP